MSRLPELPPKAAQRCVTAVTRGTVQCNAGGTAEVVITAFVPEWDGGLFFCKAGNEMTSKELRSKWLSFYEGKGHLNIGAVSLIGDGTTGVMFNVAGMQPLMPYLLGQPHPSGKKRLCNVQGCVRTVDIESVGDATHFTFFEMMGNWSLGDYFKKEKTAWTFELLTQVFGFDKDKICSTVFEGDDKVPRDEETADLLKSLGIRPENIFYLPKKDNWWELEGTVGTPCGPDNEWFYPREDGPDSSDFTTSDRYVEIGNDVYMQYKKTETGYEELAGKNVDTGFGLDRLLLFLNGLDDGYKTDLFAGAVSCLEKLSGRSYDSDEEARKAIRIIADHTRTAVMLIGDVNGILPSNTGAGYILRRLLRRAIRYCRILGVDTSAMLAAARVFIEDVYGEAYPLLIEKEQYILNAIEKESERFAATLAGGMREFEKCIAGAGSETVISGQQAFQLYDTFGFPLELTEELAEEKGMTVDVEGYHECMKKQRQTAREALKRNSMEADDSDSVLEDVDGGKTFTGYEGISGDARVIAVVKDGSLCTGISEGDDAVIVLDTTPFYAESGGQVGDKGVINAGDNEFEVTDCRKSSQGHYMHIGHMVKGTIRDGDAVTAEVDSERRMAIRRNHTSVHLLQAALRQVLGDHVHQAGSYVDDRQMRFDFTHFEAVKPEELAEVERIVNAEILSGIPVVTEVLPLEEAQKQGAIALFGEKYGDTVRVVSIGDFSKEFCGGTHASATSDLGLYRITAESSVASGVRRIEAVTGEGVLRLMDEQRSLLEEAAVVLKAGNIKEVPARASSVAAQVRALEQEIGKMRDRESAGAVRDIENRGETIGDITFFSACIGNTDADTLRNMAASLRDGRPGAVALIIASDGTKATLCAASSREAVAKGIKAGLLARAAAQAMGGNGGGKDDLAMAGGKQPEKTGDAIAAVRTEIEKCI